MRSRTSRATLTLTSLALAAGAFAVAPAAQAEPIGIGAWTSARWLDDQLTDGLVISEYDDGTGNFVTYTDYGLTLDVFYALEELLVRQGTRTEILQAIEPEVDNYVGSGDTQYAGALGKLTTAVYLNGIDPATYGAGDLLSRLEARVHTAEDDEKGRAKDAFVPGPWSGDYSNTIGQSFVVRALHLADSDLADETLAFLLKQQCDAGFFRLSLDSVDHTCETGRATGDGGASADATAFGLVALIEARNDGVTGLDDEIADGVAWLKSRQRAGGGIGEGGAVNANTTGLAAQVLLAVGETGRAGTAAAWLRGRQVTEARAEGTPLANELGAVAYDDAAFADGESDGITQGTRYQWRRATAQAASGLAALLPRTDLTVTAPDAAPRRTFIRVRVAGLEPGERYTLKRGARVVASGWANAFGRAVERIASGPSAGVVKISAVGSRASRDGVTRLRVR